MIAVALVVCLGVLSVVKLFFSVIPSISLLSPGRVQYVSQRFDLFPPKKRHKEDRDTKASLH